MISRLKTLLYLSWASFSPIWNDIAMHGNRNIAYEGADAFQTPCKIADAFQTISKDCLPSQNWIDSLLIIIANEAPVVCQFFSPAPALRFLLPCFLRSDYWQRITISGRYDFHHNLLPLSSNHLRDRTIAHQISLQERLTSWLECLQIQHSSMGHSAVRDKDI